MKQLWILFVIQAKRISFRHTKTFATCGQPPSCSIRLASSFDAMPDASSWLLEPPKIHPCDIKKLQTYGHMSPQHEAHKKEKVVNM